MDMQTNTPETTPKAPVAPVPATPQQPPVPPVSKAPSPQSSPLQKRPQKSLFPKMSWKRGVALALLLAILVLATLTYISRDALPGEPLFDLKVNVLERGYAMTKFTKSSQASYAVARMEKRLNELLVLRRDTATSSEETLRTIASLSNDHAQTAVDALTDSLLTSEGRINTLARVTTVAKAKETLAQEVPEFASSTEAFEELRKSLSSALALSVESYASTTPSDQVKVFLAEHVQNVSDALPSVAQGSSAQRIAIRRVQDAQEAIEENKLGVAILSLLKAEEALAVDGYVWGSERGEEELPLEVPVTEGQ
jgi:hypothetical protein